MMGFFAQTPEYAKQSISGGLGKISKHNDMFYKRFTLCLLISLGAVFTRQGLGVGSGPPVLSANKSDALLVDSNGNGQADPGDRLRYSIQITNSGAGAARSVVFNDTPDANTTLVVGSVTTSRGTVSSGSGAGETSVSVAVGVLAAGGGSVTITFDVAINVTLPAGTTEMVNQGTVVGDNFTDVLTDDPDSGGNDEPTRTPIVVTPIVSASKVDTLLTDNNGNGQVDPGDRLRYSIQITNSGAGAARSVVFNDTPDANTTLVVSSVTTSQGTVSSGNGAGETSVIVAVGMLAAGGASMTITFDVTLNASLPVGTTEVVNQGTVVSDNFSDVLTDDPDSGGTDEPTRTPVTLGDGDGIAMATEDQVPNQADDNTGDGNGDTILDSLQRHVTSLPTFGNDAFVTIANEATQHQQKGLSAIAPLSDAPPDVGFPFDMFEFAAEGVPAGNTVSMAIYLPLMPATNSYFMRNDQGRWQNIAQSVIVVGNKRKITFNLQDNGPFDTNPTPGVIHARGGPGSTHTAAIPALSPWLLAMTAFVLAVLAWFQRVWFPCWAFPLISDIRRCEDII